MCKICSLYVFKQICSTIQAVKYLFKYVYKGHDCVTMVLQGPIDEMKQYINVHYVSPSEAIWRQFEFKLHAGLPPITRLQIHLPNEHRITFNANKPLAEVITHVANYKTTLTEFFVINQTNELARHTFYQDMPKHFTWNVLQKKWKWR